jgi:hypothetical protein
MLAGRRDCHAGIALTPHPEDSYPATVLHGHFFIYNSSAGSHFPKSTELTCTDLNLNLK